MQQLDETFFEQRLNSGMSAPEIEKELHSLGVNTEAIAEFLKKIRKRKIAKRQSVGFMYMAAGAFIGFLSCVFTIAEVFPGFTGFVLYGLTSIAVLLVVAGLYLLFE